MATMKARRIPVLVASIAVTLAACGSSDGSATLEPATTDPTAEAEAPATSEATTEAAPADTVQETVDADAGAEVDADTEETEPDPTATDSATPPETNASSVPAAPAEPGGRALATEVAPAAQFDGNPFPDLVVADVGRSAEANLANLLPSDRPILLWAWAPH